MRIFRSTRSKIVAGLIIGGAVLVPAAGSLAGFGPNRPTFTWANPATYITFNSMTDNPSVGDERTFYTAYEAGTTNHVDQIKVRDNQEIILRAYYHNNAASNLNLVATNTRVKMNLPTAPSTSAQSTAYISADNANPTIVSDTVDFVGDQPFTLEYQKGSAAIWNNVLRGTVLSDSIVSNEGAPIGYDKIDGKVTGCAEFSGYVTIKVKVHVKPVVKPSYACKALDVVAGSERKITATVSYEATNGAVLKTVSYDFGDGSQHLVTDKTTVNYTYAKDGTYTVKATLTFTVGSTEQTAVCSKSVTVTTPTTPVVKGKSELPNTGPGDVLGVFAGASALGAAGHYALALRRNRL